MQTMKLSEAAALLLALAEKHGDVPVVLYDCDTSWYFTMTPANIELQRMQDGTVRASIGINAYTDEQEPEPATRPLQI